MCPRLARFVFCDQAADQRTVIVELIYLNESMGWLSYLDARLISLCKYLIRSVCALLVHNWTNRGAKT